MGLSRSLSPETGTLEEEEEDASEGDTELDAAEAWLGVWPLGDRVLWRRSPTPPWPPPPPPPPPPLLQDSGVSSFGPLSDRPSWPLRPGLELEEGVLVRAARASR